MNVGIVAQRAPVGLTMVFGYRVAGSDWSWFATPQARDRACSRYAVEPEKATRPLRDIVAVRTLRGGK